MKLNKNDEQLIEIAKQVALENKDLYSSQGSLVASIIKTSSGNLYKGVNIKTSHSICAEQVAIGQALACGEREFDTLVAVKMGMDENLRVVSPCGLCRYTLNKLNLDLNVIVEDSENGTITKVKNRELLPYPYKREHKKK